MITEDTNVLFESEEGYTLIHSKNIDTQKPFSSEEEAIEYAERKITEGVNFVLTPLDELKTNYTFSSTIKSVILSSYTQDKQNSDSTSFNSMSSFIVNNNESNLDEIKLNVFKSADSILKGGTLADELSKYTDNTYAFGTGTLSTKYAYEKLIKIATRQLWANIIVLEFQGKVDAYNAEVQNCQTVMELKALSPISFTEFPQF
jgi:hypothetical protein